MKKSIFTLALSALFFTYSWAKVRTVSQDAATPAQYTTVAAAITASAAGDTIYIHGSATQYPNFTVNKINLTFIGAGYKPTKENPLSTKLNYVYLDTTGNNQTGRGTKLIGFEIYGVYVGPNWGGAPAGKNNNVVISRCDISYLDVTGNNWTINNNVITGWLNIEDHSSTVISNNIFDQSYITNSDKSNVLIANNLFYRGGNVFYSNITQATIANNILVGTALTVSANVTLNNMNNNLTYSIFGITGSGEALPTTNNTGSGNIQDQDPMFNFETSVTLTATTNLTLDWDFKLQSGSPALTASASGGEIGLYAGAFPWVDNTGMGAMPYIKHMNISGVVPAGGNINIDVKAKRHN
ncbi:MAG: hypothetical protein HYU69_08350 [Bacteroidetes bacterium]|nr:hypothetical protein [Bacteroidota bacterium]